MSHGQGKPQKGQGKPQNGQGKVREFCEGSWLDTLCILQKSDHFSAKYKWYPLACLSREDIFTILPLQIWHFVRWPFHVRQNFYFIKLFTMNITIFYEIGWMQFITLPTYTTAVRSFSVSRATKISNHRNNHWVEKLLCNNVESIGRFKFIIDMLLLVIYI